MMENGASNNRAGIHEIRDLVYARTAGKNLLLDLYLPQERTGPTPLIVYLHGGGWVYGDRTFCEDGVELVPSGFAVASIEYRLSNEAPFPAQIRDCLAAVRWLRKHAPEYNLDPDRFGAMGPSAGGHLAALVGLSSSKSEWDQGAGEYVEHVEGFSSAVHAVCDWFGITDLLHLYDPYGDLHLQNIDDLTIPFLGGEMEEKRDLAMEASPIYSVSPGCPPFLILHGDQDDLVSPNQSICLHEALIEKGANSTLILFPGAGHGFDGEDFINAVEKSRTFFLTYL